MILEALNYAASWPVTEAEFRPALKYSVNLWSRAGRCAKAWAPHERLCAEEIGKAVAGLRQRRTCVVLGSGLLRDVPIRELSRAFDTVLLFDLVHLASVRLWLALNGLKTVRCISRDLSGFSALERGEPVEPLAFLQTIPYLDLVISANLLSQIGVGTQKRIEREARVDLPGDAVARLLQAHVDGLKALTPPALLLTDIRFTIVNKAGAAEDRVDLMQGVALPEPSASWDWPVAPLGEISKTYGLTHRVIATLINGSGTKPVEEGPRP